MSDLLRDQLQSSLGTAYSLERELGGGGMSRIFVARDTALGRDVVVKVLAPELAEGISAERFAREIRVAAGLQEPHIVPVLSAGALADGLPYYTMPLVRGASLRRRMDEGRVPLGHAVGVLRDVACALAYAHGQHVVHRDIKPENVLLSAGTAVVTDFGIAKAIAVSTTQVAGGTGAKESGGTLTQMGVSLGTPAYMSPEQISGEPVDQRADLYAWGVMAYELVVGGHPFAAKVTAQQLVAAHLTELPSTAPMQREGVPAALATLIMRCLEKDRTRRPQSADELLSVLDAMDRSQSSAMRRPWRPYALIAAGCVAIIAVVAVIARARATGAPDGDALRSIAVLPFENIGGDSTDAYLAHGLTDELAVTLGKVPEVRVAPRVSARVLHGRGLTTSDIAKTLDVQGVLSGTVRRGGDRLRVTAELVNASSGQRVWSDQFEESRGDVFAVQDRITRAIVGALQLRLAGGEIPVVGTTRGTTDPEAYDLYLRGRYFWSLRSEDGIRRAIDYFQRASGRDSNYVLALSGLADAYAVSAFYSYLPPAEGYGRARQFAERAMRVDSTRAEPHASLGYVALYYDWNWPLAERELRRAVTLDSSYATANQWYGNYHVAMNHPAEAIKLLQRAQRADPLNRIGVGAVCWGLYMLRRYQEAVAQCGRAIEIDSSFALARLWSGESSAMLGDTARAFRELEAAARLSERSGVFVAALARANAAAGRPDRARALLAELTPSRLRYVPSYEVALVHAALGDRTRAFEWLERAYAERSHSIALLRVDPALDPLRGDARFDALLRRTAQR
jgi:serine/threonine-protein kinase